MKVMLSIGQKNYKITTRNIPLKKGDALRTLLKPTAMLNAAPLVFTFHDDEILLLEQGTSVQ